MTTSKGTNATYLRPFASFLLYEWGTPPTAPMVAAALAGLQAPLMSILPISMRVVDGISVKKLAGVAASAFRYSLLLSTSVVGRHESFH